MPPGASRYFRSSRPGEIIPVEVFDVNEAFRSFYTHLPYCFVGSESFFFTWDLYFI